MNINKFIQITAFTSEEKFPSFPYIRFFTQHTFQTAVNKNLRYIFSPLRSESPNNAQDKQHKIPTDKKTCEKKNLINKTCRVWSPNNL